MKSKRIMLNVILVGVAGGITAGCNSQSAAPVERFRVVVVSSDQIYRLDSFNGDIDRITSDGLFPVAPHARVKLEVGRIYSLEDGALVAYEGVGKFGPATEALLRKYSPPKP